MNDDKQLERNVERLLSQARPELEMPDESKERVLSALQGIEPSSWMKGVRWIAPLAAAAALLLFLFWPGGMNGGLAWADVVRYFSEVQSVAAWVRTESLAPGGERIIREARLYQKDPGRSRSEMLSPAGSDIAQIVITNSGREQSSIARLSPREKVAHITTLTFSGAALDSRAGMPRDLVGGSWSRLKEITSDQTISIGESTISGILVVGFEIDIRQIFKEPSAALMSGIVQVWADKSTGLPLALELELTDPAGLHHKTIIRDIEWNRPLADELFQVPDMDGWHVLEELIEEIGFSRTSLRSGVEMSFVTAGGTIIMTEEDVAAVLSGRVVTVKGVGEPRHQVTLALNTEAAELLRTYTAGHRGERIRCDFNGELSFDLTIGGVMGGEVLLDITALGVTLEEFEEDYLR